MLVTTLCIIDDWKQFSHMKVCWADNDKRTFPWIPTTTTTCQQQQQQQQQQNVRECACPAKKFHVDVYTEYFLHCPRNFTAGLEDKLVVYWNNHSFCPWGIKSVSRKFTLWNIILEVVIGFFQTQKCTYCGNPTQKCTYCGNPTIPINPVTVFEKKYKPTILRTRKKKYNPWWFRRSSWNPRTAV